MLRRPFTALRQKTDASELLPALQSAGVMEDGGVLVLVATVMWVRA